MLKSEVLKRQASIKFLEVILDENISWNEHIKTAENKLSKNIGLLCKAKQLFNESIKSTYFSYIHSYLNCANITWARINPPKLKKKTLFTKTSSTNNV